jgi:hypothetical protein
LRCFWLPRRRAEQGEKATVKNITAQCTKFFERQRYSSSVFLFLGYRTNADTDMDTTTDGQAIHAQPHSTLPVAPSSADRPREVVAASVALGIIGVTLYFLLQMFFAPANIDPVLWQHQSSVLQICLALAGTVTGYYFGRIPAERAAASANQASAANAARANEATVAKNRVLAQVRDLHTEVVPSRSPLGGSAPGAASEDVRTEVARRLEQILQGE